MRTGIILGIATTLAQIGIAQAQVTFPQYIGSLAVPQIGTEISAARSEALVIWTSLTGIRIPIDDQRIISMEAKILAGDRRSAAAIATSDRAFYDIRVKNLGKKMSTKEETETVPLNDFAATFVGVVRDSDTVSAKQLLIGNFIYKADPTKSMIPNNAATLVQALRDDEVNDRILSNNHYADIERNNLSMKDVLVRRDGQNFAGVAVGNITPAMPLPTKAAGGLITTRAFVQSMGEAGTNRRFIRYSVKEFLCLDMVDWSDITQSDDRIARDVDRLPGGDNNRFQTTCKGCHSMMDPLRPAFAFVDFTNNGSRYTEGAVVQKYNQNGTVFPAGFQTANDSWVNYSARGQKGMSLLGWNGAQSGSSINAFGAMLADSDAFPRCMAQKVFSAVCRRVPTALEQPLINNLASDFIKDNYHLRHLFENVALTSECQQEK